MPETVTDILERVESGDGSAVDRLMPLVYDELRALAAWHLQQENAGHTLQPTALVNEAYLRLVEQSHVDWKSKAHFMAIAAEMIRRILVDHARRKGRSKRGGDRTRITLSDARTPDNDHAGHSQAVAPEHEIDLEALDLALDELGRLSDRQRRVVELRYFGGLSVPHTAHVLGIAEATVKADWAQARAWLFARLCRQNSGL